MPDAIAKVNGQDAFAGNIQNGLWWHKKGVQLDGQKTGAEILAAASLANWNIVKQPLFTYGVGDNATALLQVPDRVATVRSLDSHVIATVGPTYQIIQNEEVSEFADALLEVDGGVKFESAGALNDGRVVFMLASVPSKAFQVKGDDSKVMPYIVLSTGHDALHAFILAPTPVRVICKNTLNMAMSGARTTFVIRHTVNAMDRIAAARKALGVNIEYLDALKTVSVELAARPMTIEEVKKFTVKLIPTTAETPEKGLKAQAQRDLIVSLFAHSQTMEGLPFSQYRALQAVAEYADHGRAYRSTKKGDAASARALAILGGTALDLKETALRLLLPAAAKRGAGGRFAKV